MKLVHEDINPDTGLLGEVYHDAENKEYVAYVCSENKQIDKRQTFGSSHTLQDAKNWVGVTIQEAIVLLELNKDKDCPFCGSSDSRVVLWDGDEGEFEAVECNKCMGSAPRHTWNNRILEGAE